LKEVFQQLANDYFIVAQSFDLVKNSKYLKVLKLKKNFLHSNVWPKIWPNLKFSFFKDVMVMKNPSKIFQVIFLKTILLDV
jgi:hypothetical protein